MTLAIGIFGFLLVDTLLAWTCKARGHRQQMRYEVVSCPVNVIVFGIILATVQLGSVAHTLAVLYATTQVLGTWHAITELEKGV